MLRVSGLSKMFAAQSVLDDISFQVAQAERVGLVGANGSGKSTLLRIITGEIPATSGVVSIPENIVVGYLPQKPPQYGQHATIDDVIAESLGNLRQIESRLRDLEAMMADAEADQEAVFDEYGRLQEQFDQRGGYDLDYRIEIVLDGLGLGHLPRDRTFVTLSGGEAARVQLAGLLLSVPDILLLDEPTNHLDFASIDWLGDYLANHRGAILMVSHDRHLLNAVVTRILEIDEHSHRLKSYPGNYDDYRATIERERADQEERYAAQQNEINELRKAIKASQSSLNRKPPPRRDPDKFIYNEQAERAQNTVGTTIRDLRERLRRIEEDPIPKPPERLRINPTFSEDELQSSEIIRMENVSLSFSGTPVLQEVNFTLQRGERVVIVGPNGAGKSTILNLITGRLEPDEGEVVVAPGAIIGYLDQSAETLPANATLFDAYRENLVGYEHHLISDLFRHGLFTMDDLDTSVSDLSMGQRRKLQIAKMVAEGVNLLLIDEPTNFVSLDVLEEFERALAEFPGPVLAVSHDRWFIERFNGRIWELRDHRLIERHLDPKLALAGMTDRIDGRD